MLIVDHREREIIRELAKRKVEFDTKQLIVADFVINNIGIERKTQNDFINSIIDKRLFQQLIVLKENFDIPLLIIEGEDNLYSIRNMHPNAIRGMLSAIAIDFQIPIIYTRNVNDTVAL
ncbi:MAG: ERCC4 domain-containing protein, partial [Candidatus Nanoarchaeia archaeon]|nr:ERCC4 domain-containing protein [Candidatus Nanoarchaeia archaeon]